MRFWLFIAGIDGAVAVVIAAIGAHAVTRGTRAAELLATANAIHIWHALALVGVAALVGRRAVSIAGAKLLNSAGALFAAGTLLFCGSLYMQALVGLAPLPWAAPAGGTLLVLGWLALACAALPSDR